jgi:ribosomal protein S18 acetylase RimI-like enzyme
MSGPKTAYIRLAKQSDLTELAAAIAAALRNDALSDWMFPGIDELTTWWRVSLRSALRYGCVWVVGDYAGASIWIPPHASELSESENEYLPLLRELVGERAPLVIALLQQYEAARPRHQPHYYLTFLGTHPDHRGRGLGGRLLKHNLKKVDEQQMPAYLAVSDPVGEDLYERAGFRRIGGFFTADHRFEVSTMWRDAAGNDFDR